MQELLPVIAVVGLVASAATAAPGVDEGRVAYLARIDNYWQVFVMRPDGTESQQVTHSPYEKTRCSWFPEGDRLLVNSLDGRLFAVGAASGSETPVPAPVTGMVDAVVSPDGRRIAFSLSPAGSVDANEIFVMAADGSGLTKLTSMPWLQHEPEWSADGRWIYFLSGEGKQAHDLWRIDPDTRATEQISVGALYHFEVALAPDGRVAFSNNRTGNYELYVQRELEAPRQVTDDPALDGRPTWSPDSRNLIFHSGRSGRIHLWRLDLDTGTLTQLTRHPVGARSPVWWHPPAGPH